MGGINLLPVGFITRRRTRSRIRLWSRVCTLAALVAVALLVWVAGVLSPRGKDRVAQLEESRAALKRAQEEATQGRRQVVEAEAALRANMAVSDLPDWGLLLAVVPAKAGPGVTLTACTLTPRSDGGAVRPGRVERYQLTIEGVAREARLATDLALELEGLGVFENVKLLETARAVHQGRDVASFKMLCVVQDSAGGAP
jgi:Tfp pilus assembly protein PilN